VNRVLELGGFRLGVDVPPVFLTEIGAFFGQDMALASRMISDIIGVGASVPHQPMVLKTEILHDVDVCLPGDTLETYASKDGRVRQENYRALIERKVVPLSQYEVLLKQCTAAGVPFIVSIYDFTGADFAIDIGAAALKIASANLVHVPLVRHCARACASRGLPLILDTGRASIAEVSAGVDIARAVGCEDIVIEHSPDGHPALPKAHNLRILKTYQQKFGLPVGISDHHVGLEMLYMSIALGATVIEKGVHVAPDDLDIDISHTMGVHDLARVLQTVHDCWQAMGQTARDKRVVIEGVIGTSQRACLVAKRDLTPDDAVSLDTIRFAFPCIGIPVQQWDAVKGWSIVQEIPAGHPLQWSDVCQYTR
jgi:sialic acid synthase SpsE